MTGLGRPALPRPAGRPRPDVEVAHDGAAARAAARREATSAAVDEVDLPWRRSARLAPRPADARRSACARRDLERGASARLLPLGLAGAASSCVTASPPSAPPAAARRPRRRGGRRARTARCVLRPARATRSCSTVSGSPAAFPPTDACPADGRWTIGDGELDRPPARCRLLAARALRANRWRPVRGGEPASPLAELRRTRGGPRRWRRCRPHPGARGLPARRAGGRARVPAARASSIFAAFQQPFDDGAGAAGRPGPLPDAGAPDRAVLLGRPGGPAAAGVAAQHLRRVRAPTSACPRPRHRRPDARGSTRACCCSTAA